MNVRKLIIALLAAFYGLLFAGGVISYAVLAEPPPAAAWAGPLFLYAAFALVLLSSDRRLAWWLLVAAAGGFAAEAVGLQTGAVFGHYRYTAALGWQMLGVPLAIAAAWGVLLAYAGGLSSLSGRFTGALLGAAWMVAADLLIDPLASGPLDYWRWTGGGPYFGVPLANYAGWFCVSFILLLWMPRQHSLPRDYRLVGLSVIAFYAVLALLAGSMAPLALIGLGLVGLDILLARRLGRRPGARLSPFSNARRAVYVHRTEMPVSADRLFSWHLQPNAFNELRPPWQKMVVRSLPESIAAGEQIHLVLLFGPLRVPWISEITGVIPGRQFVDEQKSGPWAYWRHEHNFIADGASACIMEDRVEYALPGGGLSQMLTGWLIELQLQRLFAYRHQALADALSEPEDQCADADS